ncbi:MAG: sigma-70 family RNA polymerase sigma factor [Actinobacteria bacterium]|nr:sigma-70 family RNA polymerase sigma factor [Actinomycetota bacterium]
MARRQRSQGNEDPVGAYLREVAEHPLLSAADEGRLGRAIQRRREACAELCGPDPLSPERREQLWARVAEGDLATAEFVQANLRLVVSIAKRYRHSGLALLDLIQEGNIGLLHAVEKFDYRKGFRFSTYGTWWIRQAITRAIANTARAIHLPARVSQDARLVRRTQDELERDMGRPPTIPELAAELEMPVRHVNELLDYSTDVVSMSQALNEDGRVSLGDAIEDVQSPSPADEVIRALTSTDVGRILSVLDEREQEILRLRFALGQDEPKTRQEIGRRMQISSERVRQIEERALGKLRGMPEARDLAGP